MPPYLARSTAAPDSIQITHQLTRIYRWSTPCGRRDGRRPRRAIICTCGLDRLTYDLNHLTLRSSSGLLPAQRRSPRRCLGNRKSPEIIGSTRTVRIQRRRTFASLPYRRKERATACASVGTPRQPVRRRRPQNRRAAPRDRDDKPCGGGGKLTERVSHRPHRASKSYVQGEEQNRLAVVTRRRITARKWLT